MQGLIVSTLGSLAMALSLAEVAHVYPTTGGQYDWTYALAPVGYRNGLAYFVGWMSTAGWISLVATGSSLGANFITGIISLWSDTFEAQPYQTFLLYLSFTVGAFLLNAYAVRLLPLIDRTAFVWSLTGIVVVGPRGDARATPTQACRRANKGLLTIRCDLYYCR